MPNGIDIPELVKQIADTDLGNVLMQVLKVTGLPTVATNATLGSGVQGMYTPADNNIDLSWSLSYPNNAGTSKNPQLLTTFAHELTHAAMQGMGSVIYDRNKKFPKEIKAEYEKFSNSKSEAPYSKLILATDDDYYRASWAERLAFGVGNTVGRVLGNSPVRPVPHADATSATEFAIQADLFQRGIKQMIGNK